MNISQYEVRRDWKQIVEAIACPQPGCFANPGQPCRNVGAGPQTLASTAARNDYHQLRKFAAVGAFERPLPAITGFVIQGDSMVPVAQGYSPVFTATPLPAGVELTTPPKWATSDEANAPIASVDESGLHCTVAIPKTAAVGAEFTLTVSYTNVVDDSVATGTITATIAATQPDVTSFTVEQTA